MDSSKEVKREAFHRKFKRGMEGSANIGGVNYLRIGDAGITKHSLASEDDLMVSGIWQRDDTLYCDGEEV